MKTLKKMLCVVLALAMILGMTVTASAAYSDQASIKYTEAVGVMSALGVLEGSKGAFDPAGTLTRAQAAKIVAYMKGYAGLKAESTFTDVKGHWAESYIAVCQAMGLVDGVGNNKFNPEGKLTGYEWAKMCLNALGYNSQVNGLVGANWQVNVARLMKDAGLGAGIATFAATTQISREEAAQVAFNAIFAKTTTYNPGASILVNGTTVSTMGTQDLPAVGTELATSVFGLSAGTVTTDAYGRPAKKYVRAANPATGVTAINVTIPATPVATYTTYINGTTLYNALGSTAVLDYAKSHLTTVGTSTTAINLTTDVAISATAALATAFGANGVITEVYNVDNASTAAVEYALIQMKPTLAQVKAIAKTAATAAEGAYTSYVLGNGSTTLVTLKEYTTQVKATDISNFAADGALAVNDYVLVYGSGAYVVKKATLVKGAVTAYNAATAQYTIGGTAYAGSGAEPNSLATAITDKTLTQDTYALDAYGYVVGLVGVASAKNYLYVLGAAKASYLDATTNKVNDVCEVTAIDVNGALVKEKVYTTDVDTSAGAIADGLYEYTDCTLAGFTGYKVLGTTTAPAATVAITKGNPAVNGGRANDSTKYFVATPVAGVYSAVTSYVGYANIPSMTASYGIGVDVNADGVYDYVFLDNSSLVGVPTQYAYLTGSYTYNTTTLKYDVEAYVNGAKTTVALASFAPATDKGLKTVNNYVASDITGVSKTVGQEYTVSTAAANYAGPGFVSFVDGLLYTGSTATTVTTYAAFCDANTVTYLISASAGTCTATTANTLAATYFTQMVFVPNTLGTAIATIYVIGL